VLFASHSLLRDPPFSHLDLISCRNLLIYLERPLQQEVIATFHYALKPRGYLFLGASETADHPDTLFRPLDREAHVFQSMRNRGEAHPNLPRLTGGFPPLGDQGLVPVARATAGAAREGQDHRTALEHAAPPSILVDDHHRALHLSETAGRFLQPSGGPLTADIVELVRPELRLDLRGALDRALLHGESALTLPVLVKLGADDMRRVCIQVRPAFRAAEEGQRQAMVLFLEGESLTDVETSRLERGDLSANEALRRLGQELRITQDRLRATQEDSQAANEELRAANEELQSINEEYRSTAEELETSKEELQSINEELQTVNQELKLKLDAVSRANSDLQNLMAATDVGTLFLDQGLRIKRFTPHLTELFNITESDEGRPITDFTHQLEYEDLAKDARAVLRNLVPIEREIRSRGDGWFLVRVRPYRTTDDKIDGVVFTFVDITERRRMEQALRASEERLRHETRLVEQSRTPMFVWDFDGGVVRWNRGAQLLYGYASEEAADRPKQELLETEVPGSTPEAASKTLLETGAWSGELIHTAKDGRRITVESEMELAVLDGRRLVLESTRDITERKNWERRQELMVGELSHRVRNTLAVVQSLAAQTVRGASSPQEFVDRFNGRLAALANAHQLLVDPWKGADVAALARDQLAPYLEGKAAAVAIEGPSVGLEVDTAVPLSLVLHELATNAAKYGALSSPGGHVQLAWNLERRGDLRWVVLNWRETDGPPVKKPAKSGFGSRLIERSLPNGKVRREFQPEGVTCVIEIPLPEPNAGDVGR
jgi:two-component system CheB/CheR fusion protein